MWQKLGSNKSDKTDDLTLKKWKPDTQIQWRQWTRKMTGADDH